MILKGSRRVGVDILVAEDQAKGTTFAFCFKFFFYLA